MKEMQWLLTIDYKIIIMSATKKRFKQIICTTVYWHANLLSTALLYILEMCVYYKIVSSKRIKRIYLKQ